MSSAGVKAEVIFGETARLTALGAAVMAGNANGISANPSYFHGGTGREAAEGEAQGRRPNMMRRIEGLALPTSNYAT